MIRMCAWCTSEGKEGFLGVSEPYDDPGTTHGICDSHRGHLLAKIASRQTQTKGVS